MKRVAITLLAVIALAVLVAGGWLYLSSQPVSLPFDPGAWLAGLGGILGQKEAAPRRGVEASGIIEARTISITSETGGRLAGILVNEGEEVAAGQELARLDTALIDAEIRKAEAALRVAQAVVDLARAGAQAEAAAAAALQAWEDARAIRDAPRDLDVQAASAETQAAVAQKEVEIARLRAQAADMEQDMYRRLAASLSEGMEVEAPGPGGPVKVRVSAGPEKVFQANHQWNLASQRTWQAYASLNVARAARDGALRAVEDVQRQMAQPIALEAQVHAAEAAYCEAQAAVGVARAALNDLLAGARPEDVAVAQAGVSQAQAGLQALQVRRDKMILVAPEDGLVLERHVGLGETVAPGASIMKIADLDEVTLTLYVPQGDIGRVNVGQRALVTVDSFPGVTFEGTVTFIAAEAEFTPKNVQTKEERVHMVFAVKARIPNPTHQLKPGMPADAVILTEERS